MAFGSANLLLQIHYLLPVMHNSFFWLSSILLHCPRHIIAEQTTLVRLGVPWGQDVGPCVQRRAGGFMGVAAGYGDGPYD